MRQLVLDQLSEWYHKPKQRVVRKIILQLLANRPAGHSRFELTRLLLRRDKGFNEAYVRRMLKRMHDEGVVIVADGAEIAMETLVDLNGERHKSQGNATMDSVPVERPAKVYRLSASRWLKDAVR